MDVAVRCPHSPPRPLYATLSSPPRLLAGARVRAMHLDGLHVCGRRARAHDNRQSLTDAHDTLHSSSSFHRQQTLVVGYYQVSGKER